MALLQNNLVEFVGEHVSTSMWFAIDQGRINAFAQATDDHQFIHTDPTEAAKSSFGTTIAHGFLTLSMLSAMLYEAGPAIDGEVMSINYGFNRIRFISPVPSGARIRAVFVLSAVEEKGPSVIDTCFEVTVEIEAQDRPALIADWIIRRHF